MDQPAYIPTRKDRIVAYHEAGHAVVALALGFEVLEIDCPEKEDATAKINVLSPYGEKGLERYIVDRIAILAAGAFAQCAFVKNEDGTTDNVDYVFYKGNGRLDGMKALELANLLRNVNALGMVSQEKADSEINDIFNMAFGVVAVIFNEMNGIIVIEKIAKRMLEKIEETRSNVAENGNKGRRAVIAREELSDLARDLIRNIDANGQLTTR